MFDTCQKYGISILTDVHAMKDSQNGFDNSGKTSKLNWINATHFEHWPVNTAEWLGPWKDGKMEYVN